MAEGERHWAWTISAPIIGGVAGLGLSATFLIAKDPSYGNALFLLVPAAVGFVTSLILALTGERGFWDLFGYSALGLFYLGLGLMGFVAEGMICLLMASPLALLPLAAGCGIGRGIANWAKPETNNLVPVLVLLALVTPSAYDGLYRPDRAAEVEYTSHVDIAARPELVWQEIVSLGKLPPAHDWMSSLGLACPETTELKGRCVGAERDCTLSTGPMKERITAWEPGRRLGFVALQTPPPMRETNPFGEPHPAHLRQRYFRILYGEFRLEARGGGTRLYRTTRYEHRIRPVFYWTFLCNLAADYAHRRVLDYLKAESEGRETAKLAKR